MNAMTKTEDGPFSGLTLLRMPFPAHHVSKLPKESKAQADERKANRAVGISCKVCGGWHHKNAVHLDYVGHAALTDRLLDADPAWSWEPVAYDSAGNPVMFGGGMWIKLTVCGVTRLGFGAADGKNGGDAVKEIIGDALRNAAMRFGAALDLWHKGDLHLEGEPDAPVQQASTPAAPRAANGPREDLTYAPADDLPGWPEGPHSSKSKLMADWRKLVHALNGASDTQTVEGLIDDAKPMLAQFRAAAKAKYADMETNYRGGGDFKGVADTLAEARTAAKLAEMDPGPAVADSEGIYLPEPQPRRQSIIAAG